MFVGPDRCGKTQIAKELSKILKIPVYKASSEHENFLNKQNHFLNDLQYADPARLDLIKQLNCSIIFDRWFPCEFVYSTFFNRETDLKAIAFLDSEYAKLDTKIIFCTRKSFVGIQDDLNSVLNQKALEQISIIYEDFLQQSMCVSYKLYVDDENLNREIKEIIEFLDVDVNDVSDFKKELI